MKQTIIDHIDAEITILKRARNILRRVDPAILNAADESINPRLTTGWRPESSFEGAGAESRVLRKAG